MLYILFYMFDYMKVCATLLAIFIIYRLLVREKKEKIKGHYTKPDWNFFLKRFYAERVVKQQKLKQLKVVKELKHYESETPKILPNEESSDSQLIYGADHSGNSLLLKFTRQRHRVAEVWLILKLKNGSTFTLPEHPNTRIANATPRVFEGAGLKLECLAPYSRWRILYTGMLRKGIANKKSYNDEDLFFVKFNFIWTAASNPTFWPYDWSPKLMATSLATEKWRDGKWKTLLVKKDAGGYDQFGAIFGEVKIHEQDSSSYLEENFIAKVNKIELNLPGIRQRRWGPKKAQHLHRTCVVMGSAKDGTIFEVGAFSGKYGLTHSQFGNVRLPNGKVHPIDWTDFNLASLGEYQDKLPQATIIQIKAGGMKFVVMVSFKNNFKVPLFGGNPVDWNGFAIPLEVGLNKQNGFGVAIFWYPRRKFEGVELNNSSTIIKRIFYRSDQPCREKLLVSFAENEAQSVLVAGGKGASIAVLRLIQEGKVDRLVNKRGNSPSILNALVDQLSSNPLNRKLKKETLFGKPRAGSVAQIEFPAPPQFNIPEFHVPQGFIVSVSALEIHLETNCELKELINDLEAIVRDRMTGNVQESCEKIFEAFKATSLSEELMNEITSKLALINHDSKSRFAVRSSAVLEDGEESSAAGQNETFLGLRTNEEVFIALIKCWASLFSFQSVSYRKQHIQPIVTGMGVVIQKMVQAECAGVLFSRFPTNGDPSKMMISANYGLGESVVSGKVDPDTYLIKRSFNNELKILGSKLGEKRTLIQMDEETFVEEVTLDEEKRKTLCLTDDIVLKLAHLGVLMEKFYGSPRDIEFAVTKDNKIFLLQSRAITALNNFTDFELTHEYDTAVMSVEDIRTKANIGEIVLGAASSLTQSSFAYTCDRKISKDMKLGESYTGLFLSFVKMNHHHMQLDVNQLFLGNVKKEVGIMDVVGALAIFGYDIFDEENVRIAVHRNSLQKIPAYKIILHLMKSLIGVKKYMNELKEYLDEMKRKFAPKNLERFKKSIDLMNFIDKTNDEVDEAFGCHMKASNNSILYQMMAFGILTKKSTILTLSHHNDISLILGSMSNVESANIPEMIRDMAGEIIWIEKREEFLELDNKTAVVWMIKNCPDAHKMFLGFIERHGHRCLNEMDFISVPWKLAPEKVIEMIKVNLRAEQNFGVRGGSPDKRLNADDIMDKLKTPLSKVSRLFMKLILPKCHQGVQYREVAKSRIVGVVNELRTGFLQLGEMMVHEGFLPNKDLIFHLSKPEIRSIISSNDANIVAKAIRRQKMFSKWNELKFPDLSYGVPRPINNQEIVQSNEDGVLVRGTPVCGGLVKGRACVLFSFSEVYKIQKGDILITYGTDIAWSPYFPILGGICTELGGLISHGAVVAREYGLPCIVGAKNATQFINFGDEIILNADDGLITKSS